MPLVAAVTFASVADARLSTSLSLLDEALDVELERREACDKRGVGAANMEDACEACLREGVWHRCSFCATG